MAFIPTRPNSQALTLQIQNGAGADSSVVLNNPKLPDGSTKDLTGFTTSPALLVAANSQAMYLDPQSITCTITNAGANTFQLNVSGANIDTLQHKIVFQPTGQYSLVLGDGTDTLNAAYGTVVLLQN